MLDAVSGFQPAPSTADRPGRVLSAASKRAPLAAAGSLILHMVLAGLLLTAVRLRDPLPFARDEAVEMVFDAPASPPAPAAEPPASPPEPAAPAISSAVAPPQAEVPPIAPPLAEPPPEQAAPPPDEPAPPSVTPPVEPSAPASPATAEAPAPPPVAEQPPAAQPAPEPTSLPSDEPAPPPVTPPVEPSAPTAPPPVTVQPPLAPIPARPAPVTPRPPPPRPPPPRPSARRAVPGDAPPPVAALPASRPPAFATPSVAVPAPQPSPAPVAEVSPAWRGVLAAWLQSHKTYPAAARAAGQEGRVALRFTVDRNGRVLSAQVAASSGFSILDEAARSLLAGAQLPPFPPSMTQPAQTVTIAIRYEGER